MDLLKPRILEHSKKPVNFTIHDTKWIPGTARFCVFGATPRSSGVIEIFKFVTKKKNSTEYVEIESKKKLQQAQRVKCGTFGFSSKLSKKLCTGSFNGNLSLWDVEKGERPYQVYKAHKKIIHHVHAGGETYGPPEIVTGSEDGCVRIWDVRQKNKFVSSLEPDLEKDKDIIQCWCVAFGNSYDDNNRVVACGYSNGDLKLFDLRTNTVQWETNVKNGILKVKFDKPEGKMNILLVTTLEGKVFVFDLKTFNQKSGYAFTLKKMKGKTTVWSGSFIPQKSNYFMTGHGNGIVYLWKYKFPKERSVGDPKTGVPGELIELNYTHLTSQPLISIDWNREKAGLGVLGAFDQCVRTVFISNLK